MASAATDASRQITAVTPERKQRQLIDRLRSERERERERDGSEYELCGGLCGSQERLHPQACCGVGEKPLRCSYPPCSKAFVSKYKLLRHMATHSSQKTHQCSFCEKMFHRKDHLKNHLQTHDPNKEAFKCKECGKSYNTKLGYKRHAAMHAAASGDLTCKVCLQSYESTPHLLEHLKSHSGKTPGGAKEKKHPCDHCDRRFYTRKDVRRHMVVHTGRKDFLCQFCAQRFGRKDHLTRHVKKSHSQELLKIKAEAQDVPPRPIKEELSPVICMATGPLPMGLYGPHLQATPTSGAPYHSLVPGSLSPAMAMGCHMEPPTSLHQHHHHPRHHPFHSPHTPPPLHQHQHQHQHQSGSTSYLKMEMESFLMDLQSGLSGSTLAEPAGTPSPPRGVLDLPQALQGEMPKSPAPITESLCATSMDMSHLMGFLPLNLPPYSAPLSTGGLAMSYSTSSSSSSSSSHGAELHAASLTSLQPQPQDPQGLGGASLHPPPSVFSSSTTLPRFHQAFQ
ncbi:zinc finger protein PLAGL2-like [Megalops cyprinoides]|uniref:zinc finger protein PLAGL2-like n=1 Tax=Megalops cyprinoides TaxID=118141 RepID=UPI00186528F3|nr:zinc finger protein PLAGL2-like [Megalops cyprinoides]